MVKININGKSFEAEENDTILNVARRKGIDIPTLCHNDNLSSFGGCRLCVVEIDGQKNLSTSCNTIVQDGMFINTESEKVIVTRMEILDLMYSNHCHDCLTCEKVGECDLQNYCYEYGIEKASYENNRPKMDLDNLNPTMVRDPNKCILYGQCVRVCKEVQVTGAIDFVGRGFESIVTTGFDLPISKENCRMCGQCVSVCPTGALVNKQFIGTRPWEIEKK